MGRKEESTKRLPKNYDSKWIQKNLIVVTCVYLFTFMAYNGLANLQSSLHRDEGMGTITQSVIYFFFLFSALLLPRLCIRKLGQKWTIVTCVCGYMTWMAANGYANWWTMVPTSAIVGICAGPLWTSQASYVIKIATMKTKLNGERVDLTVSRFFGIFWGLYSISNIVSSLLSSTILRPQFENGTEPEPPTKDELSYCGADVCPGSNVSNVNLEKPSETVVWTLVGTYLVTAGIGMLMGIFLLDPIPDEFQDKTEASSGCEEMIELLAATFKMNLIKEQLLLIPYLIYPGLFYGLYFADWPQSYITCTIGISWVGLITIPAGILQVPFSYIGGTLPKYTGRLPIVVFSFLGQFGILMTMLMWSPHPDEKYVFFAVSSVQGICGALLMPQYDSLVSRVFPGRTDAAYANHQVWAAAATTAAYGYSSLLCNYVKIYIALSTWIIALIGYVIAEMLVKRGKEFVVANESDDENIDL